MSTAPPELAPDLNEGLRTLKMAAMRRLAPELLVTAKTQTRHRRFGPQPMTASGGEGINILVPGLVWISACLIETRRARPDFRSTLDGVAMSVAALMSVQWRTRWPTHGTGVMAPLMGIAPGPRCGHTAARRGSRARRWRRPLRGRGGLERGDVRALFGQQRGVAFGADLLRQDALKLASLRHSTGMVSQR